MSKSTLLPLPGEYGVLLHSDIGCHGCSGLADFIEGYSEQKFSPESYETNALRRIVDGRDVTILEGGHRDYFSLFPCDLSYLVDLKEKGLSFNDCGNWSVPGIRFLGNEMNPKSIKVVQMEALQNFEIDGTLIDERIRGPKFGNDK